MVELIDVMDAAKKEIRSVYTLIYREMFMKVNSSFLNYVYVETNEKIRQIN